MASHLSAEMHGASPIPASIRTEVLDSLIEVAFHAVNLQLDTFTSRLADAMQRMAASSLDIEEGSRYTVASQLLKKNRYAFHYMVSERLQTALRKEIEMIGQTPSSTIGVTGPRPLPPEMEVDKKLTLHKASRLIDSEHADRLDILGQRLGHLFGVDALTHAQNPFRPHVFLLVIHDAWCEFYPDTHSHHLVYPLLGPYLCIDPAPVLHALNMALIKRGILPTLAQPYRLDVASSSHAGKETTAPADPLTEQLRQLFPTAPASGDKRADPALQGEFPALFAEQDVHAVAGRNQLFSYLAEIQRTHFDRHLAACAGNGPQGASMLSHIKRQMPQGVLTQTDEHAIDLLTAIFDAIYRDPRLPDEIKTLIGSLQVPVLKSALLDKEFFFNPEQPARRTIELLARLGAGWDRHMGQNDLLYRTIERNVNCIHEASEQQSALFSKVAWELASFMTREETGAVHTLAAPIKQALRQEKKREATKQAREQVALRIGTGEIVAFVEAFLEDKWVSVLTLAYGVKEEKPEFADHALKTMDDLVWSVKPKITMPERKQLLARLPSMIANLNKWLDLIEWDAPARAQFFSELARCHASIVRAPLELSPERQMQIALRVSRLAAERRARKETERQSEPELDEFDKAVAALAHGAWLEFNGAHGVTQRLKLAWISPLRNFFIFSAKGRQESRSMTVEELTQTLREGQAQIVQMAGLVNRALMEKLCPVSANNNDTHSAA